MSGTVDLFTPVHKGLRSMIYELSGRLQTTDFADGPSVATLTTDLENDFAVAQSAGCILCTLALHAHHEEAVVFPPSAKYANRLVTTLIAEHHDLTRREQAIIQAAHELQELPTAQSRIEAGAHLNRLANELFAAYIAHMNREEVELAPLLRESFTDSEQLAMQGKIIASYPPDQLFAMVGWMLRSLNVTELSEFVSSVKAGAPPPFLKAVSDLGEAKVEAARWAEVRRRVGL